MRYVGITAGVVTSLAFSQQAYKLIKEKKSTDLTWITLSACVLGQLLWITYGYGAKDKIISTVAVGVLDSRGYGAKAIDDLEPQSFLVNEPHTWSYAHNSTTQW